MRNVAIMLAVAAVAFGADTAIDVQRSTITIHVSKAGMLSAAAHEHWVSAPIASGSLRESPDPHVEFIVETSQMSVQPDAKVDKKAQAQIQKDMDDVTLETKKFPEIAFRSSHIDKLSDGQWKVEGELTLHGITKPVSLTVKRTGDAYTTRTILKQTDFGIKPFSAGGGMIRVKNEVEIDFQIFPRKA